MATKQTLPIRGHVAEMMDMGWPTKDGSISMSATYFIAEILGPKTREYRNKKTREMVTKHYDGVIEEGPARKTRKAAEADLEKMKPKYNVA